MAAYRQNHGHADSCSVFYLVHSTCCRVRSKRNAEGGNRKTFALTPNVCE